MTVQKISRRRFLALTGATITGLALGVSATSPKKKGQSFQPHILIEMEENGNVTLWATRTEMGQGIKTALPRVIADEMEADWNRITIKQADGDPKYGSQFTEASMSVLTLFDPMREAGAIARLMLEQAAAKLWRVPPHQCRARQHAVHHTSGKSVGFGDLVDIASKLEIPSTAPLKAPKDFTYIGKKTSLVDTDDIVQGNAQYCIDIELPGMLYATIERCPVAGGKHKTDNRSKIQEMPGIVSVLDIELTNTVHKSAVGVAIVAQSRWQALKARQSLDISWQHDKPTELQDALAEWEALLDSPGKTVMEKAGGYIASEPSFSAIYSTNFMKHAPLEPAICVAKVSGDTCEVWAPVQTPQVAQREIAKMLGVEQQNVTVHVTLTGGAFGRKGFADYILEAVKISKQSNAPVQLLWSREDEVQQSIVSSPGVSKLEATLDRQDITSWRHRTAFPTISRTYTGKDNVPNWEYDSGMRNLPYEIPVISCEHHNVIPPQPVYYMRGVHNYVQAFAIRSFVDELAHEVGADPLSYHLARIGASEQRQVANELGQNTEKFPLDTARLKTVIQKAAELANWGKELPEGEGMGLAYDYCRLSYSAHVIHVKAHGREQISVKKVYSAIDCGRMINPNSVKAQVEGSIIFGLSSALYGRITTLGGAVEQSNFHDYQILRSYEAPDMDIHLIESEAPPTGLGEAAISPVAPALTNALFVATGERVRSLPILQ